MDQHWGISNWVMPVSHDQFTTLTTQFKQAAQSFFSAPCRLEIRAMDEQPVYSTFILPDEFQGNLDQINAGNTILKTDKLSDISAAVWNKARYVDVTVRPVDESKAPDYAFGHVEFKGAHSRQATFYIQAGGKDEKEGPQKSFIAQYPHKLITDGWETHGTRVFDRAPGMNY